MEVSGDASTAYIAGLEVNPQGGPDRPKVVAVRFDRHLNQLGSVYPTQQDYKRINRMRRIKGEEVMVLGCNRHFSLIENVGKGDLKEIYSVANVHKDDILDFEFRDRFMYSRGEHETDIKVTEFGVKKAPPPPPVEVAPPMLPPPLPLIDENFKPIVYQKNKYELFKRFKIDCSFVTESFEKIAVGSKGNRVYTGGKGLYVFDKDPVQDDKYKVLNYEGNEKKRFFSLKATKSGHIMAQEATTNDLMVMDNTGEVIMRKNGTQPCEFGKGICLPRCDYREKPTLHRRVRRDSVVLRHHIDRDCEHARHQLQRDQVLLARTQRQTRCAYPRCAG